MPDYQIQNRNIDIISVLIVSCDVFVAQGLFSYLKNTANISVIDRLYSADSHIHAVLKQQPDILLIHTSGITSLLTDVCQQLEFLQSTTKCIFLLASDDPKQYLLAIKAGAKGVLSYNNLNFEELISIIYRIYAGEFFITPTIAYRIVKELCILRIEDTRQISESTLATLTQREIDILSLLAIGKSNRNIAENLCIEIKTVKNHLTNIYSKIGVNGRTEAIAIYYTNLVNSRLD